MQIFLHRCSLHILWEHTSWYDAICESEFEGWSDWSLAGSYMLLTGQAKQLTESIAQPSSKSVMGVLCGFSTRVYLSQTLKYNSLLPFCSAPDFIKLFLDSARMPALLTLELTKCRVITPEDMKRISAAANLRVLDMSESPVEPSGLHHMSGECLDSILPSQAKACCKGVAEHIFRDGKCVNLPERSCSSLLSVSQLKILLHTLRLKIM